MKFTVYRSKWARGWRLADVGTSMINYLRGPDGQQCCLGFVARELGCSLNVLYCIGAPVRARELTQAARAFFLTTDDRQKLWINAAVRVNDDRGLTDEERERQLQVLFSENGHEIVFEP